MYAIVAELDTGEREEFSFPAVLSLNVADENDEVCVVMSESCAEQVEQELFAKGCADLTNYAETTFVFPDEIDVPKLRELQSSLQSDFITPSKMDF